MARKPRIIIKYASYHVYAQINRQNFFLKESHVKELLMFVFKEAGMKYDFSIRNFCIMDNHFHLDITPASNASLSRIMQWIMSMFARYYNKLMGQVGRVWRGRFKSRVISTLKYFYRLFEYISNNPVRAGIVKRAEDYPYSGLFYILENKFSIIAPPDDDLKLFVSNLLTMQKSVKASDVAQRIEVDESLGFYPQKPGRKKN